MRSGNSKIWLLALVFGAVAAILSWRIVQQQAQAPVPMARVVVAAQDIPVRTKITGSMLKEVEIPAAAKHPEALSSIRQAEGQVSRLPITGGEQVLITKFTAAREESGLSFIIPPSKRAVALNTNEVTGAGGLILPGDRVDVVAVFDAKTMGKDMSAIILQDIEVLAVAQSLEGELPAKSALDTASQALDGKNATPTAPKTNPKPLPLAKTVTLAVTPEEAQRLFLAESNGKIRLALRANQERTRVDLTEATLSTIRSPLRQGAAEITAVSISPVTLNAGDVMKVEITVKNISNAPIRSQGPEPGFTYVQGQTFQSQNFGPQTGAFRVGLNFGANRPVEYPYRWGLGGELAPGASTTVVGYVKVTSGMAATDYWAGLIEEPANVTHDNVGLVKVTVTAADMVLITVDAADLRSGPNISSPVIGQVFYGNQLKLLGQEADWYKVQVTESGLVGYIAAGWAAVPTKG
ncbi:MAG: Flp pilus assembly protein CpaB [Chloroflexi bacterium]|nr:Flp pilus assembly protein CpaB [Chloroflexota bacterium]